MTSPVAWRGVVVYAWQHFCCLTVPAVYCDAVQYGERLENAEFGAEFMQSMTYFTQHSLQGGTQSLRDAYDWKSAKCIMDVGGGRGELLSNCMSWAGPKVKGVLFDRPFVIEG